MNMTSTGFLVVLTIPESRGERSSLLNPKYLGVDRVPKYPSPGYPFEYPEEAFALDEYVFGNVKSDETNLIPDFEAASKLWDKFSSSPREFEIILCCLGLNDPEFTTLTPSEVVALGYDVAAVKSDGWSIVSDFATNEWAKFFLNRLNEYGLFRDRSDAENYLREYRAHNEPDADCPFEIVYVAKAKTRRREVKENQG